MAAGNLAFKAEASPSFPEVTGNPSSSNGAADAGAAQAQPNNLDSQATASQMRVETQMPGSVIGAGGNANEWGHVEGCDGAGAQQSGGNEDVEAGEAQEEAEEGQQSSDDSDGGGSKRGCKAGDSEVSDDGTGILAPHTKVVVIGNNRTKPEMVGLRGCVKKSVGLGGWHFLRLASGEEVKLQRNALSVLELPSGNEPDFTDDEEEQILSARSVVSSRKRRVKAVGAGELSRRVAGKRNVSAEANPVSETKVDFSKLDIVNLRKYRRHYRLSDVPSNSSKDQLVRAVTRHFRMQTVDEGRVMSQFYRAIQKHGQNVT